MLRLIFKRKEKPKNRDIEYQENYQLFLSGKMSRKQWMEYAKPIFYEILKENKETFQRLKYK